MFSGRVNNDIQFLQHPTASVEHVELEGAASTMFPLSRGLSFAADVWSTSQGVVNSPLYGWVSSDGFLAKEIRSRNIVHPFNKVVPYIRHAP